MKKLQDKTKINYKDLKSKNMVDQLQVVNLSKWTLKQDQNWQTYEECHKERCITCQLDRMNFKWEHEECHMENIINCL